MRILEDTTNSPLQVDWLARPMHEVNNRLEAHTNLIYLARAASESPLVVSYLTSADGELRGLGEITSKSLGFIRVDTEARDIDLVELANLALHLHRVKISSKRINVQTRSEEAVVASVKRGEIFHVLTNLFSTPLTRSLTLETCTFASSHDEAIITIADSRTGIPEAMRASLFSPFKSSRAAVCCVWRTTDGNQ